MNGNGQPLFAAVELGGTKSIALIARGSQILDRYILPTTEPAHTLPPLADWLAAQSPDYAAFGMASFGPVRIAPGAPDYGHILATPKAGWANVDVLAPFAGLGLPMAIDTDVNAAALAEFRWGAGRGASSVTYITIGTGIGGGTMVDGLTIKGRLHPEIGHIRSPRQLGDSFAGNCPFHGDCAEGLLAGPSLAARFGEPPANVAPGDPRWDAPAADLAHLLMTILLSYAPQRILLGGGVSLGAPWLIDRAIERLPDLLGGYFPDLDLAALQTMITAPALGNDAGPLGAVAVAELALASQ